MSHSPVVESLLATWLARSARWRVASLLLQPPTAEALAELRQLVRQLPRAANPAVADLLPADLDAWESEYHEVLGPAGCPASESAYEESALANRGPLLAELAAHYEAFGYAPAGDVREVPDHVSVELGFLSYLALKVAFAIDAGDEEKARITSETYDTFRRRRLRSWLPRLRQAIAQAPSPFFAAILAWVETLTADELDEIARACAARPIRDRRPADEIIGYDRDGLPR